MSDWYVDTSAAAKLVVAEAETRDLVDAIAADRPRLVSSLLLETELRRMAPRIPGLSHARVTALLDRFALFALEPGQFTNAGAYPGAHLRTLDALHIASAIDLRVEAMVTYDPRLESAARDMGLHVVHPGRE